MVNIDELKYFLNYDETTGIFTWKINKGTAKKNNEAGNISSSGYKKIKINGKYYLAHRLAWFYFYKYMPTKLIDHINGNKSDNRIINLREATRSENLYNSKKSKINTSGIKGVDWHKQKNKWRVRLSFNNKRIEFGHFDNLELAELVAQEARAKYHGNFARD